MLSVRVEEEFLLLAPHVAGPSGPHRPGYLAYRVATASGTDTRIAELRQDLVRLRRRTAIRADRAGASLVSVGAPPFEVDAPDAATDEARYRALRTHFPAAGPADGTFGCHVHVGIPDRELAVEILARIRPWLPALLALTVNSPYAGGVDTGWASYRYHLKMRRTAVRAPVAWAGTSAHDRTMRLLSGSGATPDAAGVYFSARLSERGRALEVRVADACLSVEDTVLFAGVVRALVLSLIDDARRNVMIVPVPTGVVAAHLLTAAHGQLRIRRGRIPPGVPPAAAAVVSRLIAKVAPALATCGDGEDLHAGLERLRREGTGAERQRRAWPHHRTAEDLVAYLADATTAA
jgi:carboxylate-amine ligase